MEEEGRYGVVALSTLNTQTHKQLHFAINGKNGKIEKNGKKFYLERTLYIWPLVAQIEQRANGHGGNDDKGEPSEFDQIEDVIETFKAHDKDELQCRISGKKVNQKATKNINPSTAH